MPAGEAGEGPDQPYNFMAPVGGVEHRGGHAASDPTWGGSVDDGRLASIDSAAQALGGEYLAAGFHFDVV